MAPTLRAPLALLLVLVCVHSAVATWDNEWDHHHENVLSKIRHDRILIAINNNTQISYNISTLNSTDTWVNVTFSGVGSPGSGDFVGLYVPADANVSTVAPVKFKFCNMSTASNYSNTGAGSLNFQLLNLRKDMRFVLFTNGTDRPILVAQGPVISNTNPNEPTQGRLSLTSKLSEMKVTWTTSNSSNPQVKWGTAPGALTNVAPAVTKTYSKADLCGPPSTGAGYFDPGVFHIAIMTGLAPSTVYFYTYGSDVNGYAAVANFTSAPPVGADQKINILMIADVGRTQIDGSNELGRQETPSYNTTSRMAREPNATLAILNGDLSYADGYLADWDSFGWQFEALTRRMPLMTVEGNHERDSAGTGDVFTFQNQSSAVNDSRGECGVVYSVRHEMPGTAGPNATWYSYNYGPIHFLAYDTELPLTPGTPQYAFMAQDLAAVDRSKTPWVVLNGHRPIYEDSTNNGTVDSDVNYMLYQRAAFENLLYQYQVDLSFCGHTHYYLRTCPIYNGTCMATGADGTAGATRYLVIGNAGRTISDTTIAAPARPAFVEQVARQYGYLRVTADGQTFTGQAIRSDTGEIIDTFTLSKPLGWTFGLRTPNPIVQTAG